MVTRESVEELARRMCRELYEFTDGQPNKSRRIVGGDQMHRAILFAIGCGWLKVDSQGMRIGLTDDGRQEVRKMLS
jgi:hypothetical protein